MTRATTAPSRIRVWMLAITTALLAPLAAGCATPSLIEGNGEEVEYGLGSVTNVQTLVQYLDTRGMRIETYGLLTGSREVHSAANHVYGLQLQTHRGQIVVYEYSDEATAHRDARRLDLGRLYRTRDTPTGRRTTETTAPVFQHGELIVVYLGRDPAVTNAIRRVMGDQLLR